MPCNFIHFHPTSVLFEPLFTTSQYTCAIRSLIYYLWKLRYYFLHISISDQTHIIKPLITGHNEQTLNIIFSLCFRSSETHAELSINPMVSLVLSCHQTNTINRNRTTKSKRQHFPPKKKRQYCPTFRRTESFTKVRNSVADIAHIVSYRGRATELPGEMKLTAIAGRKGKKIRPRGGREKEIEAAQRARSKKMRAGRAELSSAKCEIERKRVWPRRAWLLFFCSSPRLLFSPDVWSSRCEAHLFYLPISISRLTMIIFLPAGLAWFFELIAVGRACFEMG